MKKKNILIESVKLIESVGDKYRCIIIEPGVTLTANTIVEHEGKQVTVKKEYPAEVLKEAFSRGVFEGVPFLVRSEDEHLTFKNNTTDNIAGYFTETKWDDELNAGTGLLNIRKGSTFTEEIKSKLSAMWESTKQIGLSIAAYGEWQIKKIGNEFIATVNKIAEVTSIDPCAVGNAGGKIVQLVESAELNKLFIKQNKNKMELTLEQRQAILEFLKAENRMPTPAEGEEAKPDTDYTDAELTALVTEEELASILAKLAATADSSAGEPSAAITEAAKKLLAEAKKQLAESAKKEAENKTKNPEQFSPEELKEAKKVLAEAKAVLNEQRFLKILAESKLPAVAKSKIEARYKKLNFVFDEPTLKQEIKDTSEILAESVGSFFTHQSSKINLGMEQLDKYELAMDWLLSNSSIRKGFTDAERKKFAEAGVTGLISFKEFYKELTGDVLITGKTQPGGKLAESISTSTYTNLLGVSMHRTALRAYKQSAYNNDWEKICKVVPRLDYKENTLIYKGGYGNLPTVAEGAVYTASTSPAEQAQKYTITKRGYTEDITREAIMNDDLKEFQRIPFDFGEASARTLYEFAFNFILSNPTMLYDSTVLFHADHNNLLTAALDAPGLAAARLKMFNQTDLTNSKKLGYNPKYLCVPVELQSTAYGLVTPAYGQYNDVNTFIQTWQLEPIVIAHMTDANDWYLVGDPMRGVPTIEIAFLNGNKEPEIFVQDEPTQGNVFTNDKITFKIRHEYNGAVENHRGFIGNIVA